MKNEDKVNPVDVLLDVLAPDDDSDETVRADLAALGVDVDESRERFEQHLDALVKP